MWTRVRRGRLSALPTSLRGIGLKPDGRDCPQDQALPDRSDRGGVAADPAAAAGRAQTRAQADDGPAGSAQRDPHHGAQRQWLADAAEGLSPWPTVYWWFRRFVRLLLFRTIHDVAMMLDREQAGREASPSGGILDSYSVKALHGAIGGYDAGKKVLGRKRHIAVDTDARLLMVNLTSADVSDGAGAQTILAAIRKRWPWLKHLFANGAYDRGRMMSKAAFLDFVVEIVRRMDHEPGFKVLPRRLRGLPTAQSLPEGTTASRPPRHRGRTLKPAGGSSSP